MATPSWNVDGPRIEHGSRRRLPAVDLLRGLAIVLMALDHVREYLQAQQYDPLDLSQTTPALFFTRWITHFCAPVFLLLAGAAIALGLSGARSRNDQAAFVLTRGIWLVVLELTVVHVAWFFNFQLQSALGQVIWAIGWSMIVMSLLLYLPSALVTALGIALIALHNAFDSVSADSFRAYAWLWRFLHDGGPVSGSHWSIYIAYPLIPWVGVMAAGFGFGQLLKWDSPWRTRVIVGVGLVMIALFVVLRGGNIYGDPNPWSPHNLPERSLMAVLNCDKYPPSLAFLLMTLGPALAAWPLWERGHGRLAGFLITFGRVPLFFYVVHLYVIHLLTIGIAYGQTGTFPHWLWSFPPGHAGPGCGLDLPALYAIWIGIVLVHYPVCRWYDGVKTRHPRSLLRFL